MTVIAYSRRHRMMASDSRCANDNRDMHLTNCTKVSVLKNGALYGSAGEADDRDLIALLERSSARRMPRRTELAELKLDAKALVVFRGGHIFRVSCDFVELGDRSPGYWNPEVLPIRDTMIAIGSGAEYAYGAMTVGADPKRAVWAACKRDLLCALPVQSVRLP